MVRGAQQCAGSAHYLLFPVNFRVNVFGWPYAGAENRTDHLVSPSAHFFRIQLKGIAVPGLDFGDAFKGKAGRIEMVKRHVWVLRVLAAALVGSGPMVLLNGDDMFPMASTYTVAIAVAVSHDVDEGKLSLDQMLSLQP